jgi:Lipase maturation factor
MKLLEHDPFEGEKEKPKYIRVDRYRYRFSREDKRRRYWDREMLGRVYPRQGVVTKGDLRALVEIWSN